MSPRTGRPTNNPRNTRIGIRLNDKEVEMLKICEQITGLSKTEIISKGIELVYQEVLMVK